MQRGPDTWYQRRSRDRNLDIFDKALIRYEQRGGRRAPQQLQSQPNLHRVAAAQRIPPSGRDGIQASGIAEPRGELAGEDSEMSRSSYQQYSRSSVSTSGGGGGGGGGSGLLLPRRTYSNVGGPDFWSRSGGGLSGSGFQRQEVFRRSFRQAPAVSSSGSRQSQSFYSHSSTGGGVGGGFLTRPASSAMFLNGGGGVRRVSVTETSTTSSALGQQHQQQQQLGGAGSAAAYFSEGLVISPGSQQQQQHQQQYLVERQQLQHGSTGSVERELLNYRQTDGGVSSRFHQVSHAAASSPENVHSEGFLIQRRTVGHWQNAAGDTSREHQQQHQQVMEHHHQRQQSGGEYPVLRVRQPYKMNFVMSREAPAAYHSAAGSDAVREQFASHLYNSRRGGGRQSVMGQGDSNGGRSYYQQHIVYHENRGQSPRAFVPYPQAAAAEATVQRQTTLTRGDGYGTIKEGTIHKHQAAEKSTARKHDIEVGLSRLELQQAGGPQQNSSQEHTTITTTKTAHTEHKSNERAQEDAAAALHRQQQQQVHKQSTVSKVAMQNEQHEEEATYFHDGNRVRKRVKHRRYLDGKLIDEKEEVASLNEEERKQMEAQQRQWQWKTSTNANGQTTTTTSETTSHHTGQTAPASSSESRAVTITTTTSSAGVRPKKRACACCYPRHRRYKSDARAGKSGTTTTTTTASAGDHNDTGKPGKKTKRDKKHAATTTTVVTTSKHAAEQQNGRARQVAFEGNPVYN